MQDIFEQVDEQLELDRVQEWWKANRKWLISGLVLFFLLLFAYVGWRDYQARQNQAASEQFVAVQELLTQKEADPAQKALQALQQAHPGHGYAQFGRFLQARLLAEAGNRAAALEQLELLVKESQSALLSDLALLNAAYLTVDEARRAETFLARIDPHSPYRAHVLELQGLLAAQQGDQTTALARYREARGLAPDGSLRSRLESRLERMGEEEKK
ncbi:MAG: tetratricopeptide repeat protein [Magnetococcales bacterium]|nr:tetratricopeptide repeat protein [Magnetococcales bacterium]